MGDSYSISAGEWSFERKYQIGLYSEATILSVAYTPENENLPAVSIALDMEVNHLVKVGVGVVALGAAYAPQVLPAVLPTVTDFLNQLVNFTPAFSVG